MHTEQLPKQHMVYRSMPQDQLSDLFKDKLLDIKESASKAIVLFRNLYGYNNKTEVDKLQQLIEDCDLIHFYFNPKKGNK
jgi:hypothetical protein